MGVEAGGCGRSAVVTGFYVWGWEFLTALLLCSVALGGAIPAKRQTSGSPAELAVYRGTHPPWCACSYVALHVCES